MVDIGDIIEATVERVESYGVFLKHGSDEVFVVLPEVSWLDQRPLRERIHVGETHRILVLRFNYQQRQIVGSIRRTIPEDNPYRALSKLEPGTVLPGRVVFLADRHVTVELKNHALGDLAIRQDSYPLQRGADVDVVITSLEVDEGKLTLGLAANSPKQLPASICVAV